MLCELIHDFCNVLRVKWYHAHTHTHSLLISLYVCNFHFCLSLRTRSCFVNKCTYILMLVIWERNLTTWPYIYIHISDVVVKYSFGVSTRIQIQQQHIHKVYQNVDSLIICVSNIHFNTNSYCMFLFACQCVYIHIQCGEIKKNVYELLDFQRYVLYFIIAMFVLIHSKIYSTIIAKKMFVNFSKPNFDRSKVLKFCRKKN